MSNDMPPAAALISRIERLEHKVDDMELSIGTLKTSFATLREDISVHVGAALNRTEKKIIKTMQDEVVSKLQALLDLQKKGDGA
jgi:hypothetical protein